MFDIINSLVSSILSTITGASVCTCGVGIDVGITVVVISVGREVNIGEADGDIGAEVVNGA